MDYFELYEYVKGLKDDIKDVKADVKDVKVDIRNTFDEVKKINGRLRKVEGEIIRIDGVVEARGITCAKKLDDLTPSIPIMKQINVFFEKPKLFLLLFVMFIVIVQTVVFEAVQNNWIGELLKFIKP